MQTLLIVEDDFDLNHAICLALEKRDTAFFRRHPWKVPKRSAGRKNSN